MRGICAPVLCILCAANSPAFQGAAGDGAKPGGIQGRVVEVNSGEPVRKAVVIVRGGNEPGTGAYTDAAGKFMFQAVEPGAYTVSAERDGFVAAPESERRVVNVKPGATESDVTLRLARTGAISGRVLDHDGEPVAGASVQILSMRERKGGPATSIGGGATTNDRGEYRAFNIAPGKYQIAVSYTPRFQHMDVKMQRAGRVSAGAPEDTYATTYYPGTLDARQAAVVQVEPGADLQGFDVQLLQARAVRIRGRISGPGGASSGLFVVVSLEPVRAQAGVGQPRSAWVRSQNGEFEIGKVLPGRYVMSATSGLEQNKLFARRLLEVNEADIDGIQLTLAGPQKISGTVIVPPDRKLPPGLLVVLTSRERLDAQSGGVAEAGGDGAFTMSEVPPGDYDVAVANTGAGDDLYVNSIRMGEHDALAEGIHVGGAPAASLEIVLKPNGGTVEGSVADSEQKPMPGALVMLLPDPPRRLQLALYSECRTDATGTCKMVGVTPGEYHAFAIAKEGELDWRDADAMKGLEKHGKPVKIAEGEQRRVELEPVPVEQ